MMEWKSDDEVKYQINLLLLSILPESTIIKEFKDVSKNMMFVYHEYQDKKKMEQTARK